MLWEFGSLEVYRLGTRNFFKVKVTKAIEKMTESTWHIPQKSSAWIWAASAFSAAIKVTWGEGCVHQQTGQQSLFSERMDHISCFQTRFYSKRMLLSKQNLPWSCNTQNKVLMFWLKTWKTLKGSLHAPPLCTKGPDTQTPELEGPETTPGPTRSSHIWAPRHRILDNPCLPI